MEERDLESNDRRAHRNDRDIAPGHIEQRHVREVHAVPAGDEGERHGDRRHHGQPLHNVVLPDIDALLIERLHLQAVVLQRLQTRGKTLHLTRQGGETRTFGGVDETLALLGKVAQNIG